MCQAFVILASNIFCNYIFVFRTWIAQGLPLGFCSSVGLFLSAFRGFLGDIAGWLVFGGL
jgi:hypothetical protein